MKIIRNIFLFIPTLLNYLRGVNRFYVKRFEESIAYFEKCLDHPNFNTDQFNAYYGQALAATGQLEKAYGYLKIAFYEFEENDWSFENEQSCNLAKDTIGALEHIEIHTGMSVEKDLDEMKSKIKQKSA